jgi:hypothetical protein
MRRTRPLVALVLVAMLALSAAACGDDTEDDRIPFTGERPTTTTIPEDEEDEDEAEDEDENDAEDGQDGDTDGESEDAPSDDGGSTDAAAA